MSSTCFSHYLHGFTVLCDRALWAGAPVTENAEEFLVQLREAESPISNRDMNCLDRLEGLSGRELKLFCDQPLSLGQVPGRRWVFEVTDTLAFYWVEGVNDVIYELKPGCDTLGFWAVQLFLPMLISHITGALMLHGSAVNSDRGAFLFLAPTCGGKSTLAHWMSQQGYAFMADDKIRLQKVEDEWRALPAHPFCRPSRTEESLGVFQPGYLPLGRNIRAIVELAWTESPEPYISKMSGIEAFSVLRSHQIMDYHPNPEHALLHLSDVARECPLIRLYRPKGMQYMSVVRTVLESQ